MKKLIMILVGAIMITLCGAVAVPALATSGDKITIDTTYLKKAVVSANAIELDAEIRDSSKRIKYGTGLIWTVTEGNDVAEIVDDNKIIFKKAGDFTVKVCEDKDEYTYSTFAGKAYEATFSNVTINNTFENITVNTQPSKLYGDIEVRGIAPADDCHYELVFEILSGPAEISFGNFLRITGKGQVVLQASSRYDSNAKTSVTFNVTDPDEGKIIEKGTVLEQEHITAASTSGSCGSITFVGFLASVLVLGVSVLVIKRK